MSRKLVCCGMWHVCAKQVVYFTVHVCNFPYSVLSVESSWEKEQGEFSMLSTVDMCAACFAVSSLDSTGAVKDKQNNMLSFDVVEAHCCVIHERIKFYEQFTQHRCNTINH